MPNAQAVKSLLLNLMPGSKSNEIQWMKNKIDLCVYLYRCNCQTLWTFFSVKNMLSAKQEMGKHISGYN